MTADERANVSNVLRKMEQCAERDACDYPDCAYYTLAAELTVLIDFLNEVLEDSDDGR